MFNGAWTRYRCCPRFEMDLPSPPQNLMILVVTGYYYSQTPTWFDQKGIKMMPTQFSADPDNLLYRYTFYRPTGYLCRQLGHGLGLTTLEDIKPVIHDAVTGTHMQVRREARHNGYTHWRVYCD